jgi:hypothetical protein
MTVLAIDLDDAALALLPAADDHAPEAEPVIAASIVRAVAGVGAGAAAPVGAPAAAELRRHPTEISTRHWLRLATHEGNAAAAAALACAELRQRLAALPGAARGATRSADVCVPPHLDAVALSWALGALRGAGLEPRRLVDSAALRCAALGLARDALVLDVGLHHVAVSRVVSGPDGHRRTTHRWRAGAGSLALQDAWLALAAEAMVLRHRFDPLHDGATEQCLYDALPAAAATAATQGSATLGLMRGGQQLEIELTRDQFAARAAPVYRELMTLLHSLRPAGAPLALLVDARVAAWPGLVEQLDELHGCVLHVVASGTNVRALRSLLAAAPVAASTTAGAVRLQRQVAKAATPLPAAAPPRILGSQSARATPPTHVLYAGRAWPLRGTVVEIGRSPDSRGIALPDGTAGVSRLHCSLRDEAGEIVLVDHSRYGSWVNGERVAARVRLRAGDTLRVGDPGVDLALIAVAG